MISLFLSFIGLLAWAGNAALFETFSLLRVAGGRPFNLLIFSLLVVWWRGYYAARYRRRTGLITGHALLTLSCSLGLGLLGCMFIMSESCEELMTGKGPISVHNQVLEYISAAGYCSEVGYLVLIFGLFLA